MSHEGIRKTNLLQKLLNIRGERFLLILTDHAEKKGFAENQLKLHILNWLNGFLQRDEQGPEGCQMGAVVRPVTQSVSQMNTEQSNSC